MARSLGFALALMLGACTAGPDKSGDTDTAVDTVEDTDVVSPHDTSDTGGGIDTDPSGDTDVSPDTDLPPDTDLVPDTDVAPDTDVFPTDTDSSALAAACTSSGGTVSTGFCCTSTSDFPNTCAVGGCGCAPQYSHTIQVCECPANTCWDGSTCQ